MSRMANAGVETGANMFGVCTGPSSPKAPGAPRAMEASPLSPTIAATRIAHTMALNPWHGDRSTNRHRAFSTDLVAWLTLPSSPPRRHVRMSAGILPSVRESDAAGGGLLIRMHVLIHE